MVFYTVVRGVDMPLDDNIPLPLDKFEVTTKGKPEHVYMLLLKRLHGREKHTLKGWTALLQSKKSVLVK